MPNLNYTALPVHDDNRLVDVRLVWPGRTWHLWGRTGIDREVGLARELLAQLSEAGGLPVFLGSGLGMGLETFLREWDGPVAVVDREEPILGLTRARERFAARPGVLWIDAPTAEKAMAELSRWQMEQGGGRFVPAVLPVYPRLDRDYYDRIRQSLLASSSFDFWGRARYPRFTAWPPRLLLLTSKYFLMGEVKTACERLSIPHLFIDIGARETGRTEFVEKILQAVVSFRPDFVLTINHLGVDREGVLVDLLERLGLPLASWFVDNPHLILYSYARLVSPLTAIFTWDADNVESLKAMGFPHVFYLPLGCDTERFSPRPRLPDGHPWRAPISFVGNSMLYKVGGRLREARPPRALLKAYRAMAIGFGRSEERSVSRYLAADWPELYPLFRDLPTEERRLAFEAAITWESTRLYRASCVRAILPFEPLIAGDKGWKHMFRHEPYPWRYHPELGYYEDLPDFYPQSEINFNCTSLQMKGAVNQRVFDVPACGGFLLTDHRRQIEQLFEPGREVALYHDIAEIPDLVRHYLGNAEARHRIAEAGRRRVLAEHTYEKRLTDLCRTMGEVFS